MKHLILSSLFLLSLHCTAAKQPNIVLFFVDDMGWADMGYRNPEIFETPNLDALAKESIDFQQAYIASPTCSPSRGTLVTGLHPARLKLVRHIPNNPKFGADKFGRLETRTNLWPTDPAQFPCVNWLDLEYTTYAEALRELGYYNLFVGKWHLGHEPYHPVHNGFDRQIGTTNWGHPKGFNPPYFKFSDVMKEETEQYLTDRLADETAGFIRDYDGEQPFMISLWYYTVHSPHDGRPDLVERMKKKNGQEGKFLHYTAMVKAMDESIGHVRAALEEKGIADNTVIIFLSDQGSMFQNGAFRGGKMQDTLYEGGSRVPFMINWPGVLSPGQNNSVVQSTDLFPTLVDIAGGDASAYDLDGVSLLPAIKANRLLNRGEPIYAYRAYEDLYVSVREGDWKLMAFRSGMLKLYNIAKDEGETTDLAASNPEKVAELKAKLVDWEQEMDVVKYSGVQ